MKELIKVIDLYKKDILDNINFSIKEGEMAAIMGPSGSGKSTLLYELAGMDRPDRGNIFFMDQDITTLDDDRCAGMRLQHMGFVFQQMNMMSDMDILDNIMLPAIWAEKKNKARKPGQLEAKALGYMAKLGLGGLEKRRINEVSGGQLQRACICRALMNLPSILFADEPTGALNQKASKEVMSEFIRLNRENTTILIVTHDSHVAKLCDKVYYLLDGRITDELSLGKYDEKYRDIREERMRSWLSQKE